MVKLICLIIHIKRQFFSKFRILNEIYKKSDTKLKFCITLNLIYI